MSRYRSDAYLGCGGAAKTRPHIAEKFARAKRRFEDRYARIQAGYDAAEHSEEYARHWAKADAFDADTANSRERRHTLMHRSRYEAGSNGYYGGTISTYVNMLVGTGPSLRVLLDDEQQGQARKIEADFAEWAETVHFYRKLWCLCHTYVQDGEGFAMFTNNEGLPTEVQLDLMLMEGEQVQTPLLPWEDVGYIDGLKLDQWGNVEWYDVLPEHPGSSHGGFVSSQLTPVRVAPSQMIHLHKMKRPQEHRSVPMCTPSLMVGANARRWREATLAAAETAADYSLLLHTSHTPEEVDGVMPMTTHPIAKRMMTALPEGWGAEQLKAQFPSEFASTLQRDLISEQSRPMSMPYNQAAMDSSTYSFASGKLDTLSFRAEINVGRSDLVTLGLNPIYQEWWREYQFTGRGDLRRTSAPPVEWTFPAHPVIDEVADATSTKTRLESGQTTLRRVYADKGLHWETELVAMAQDYLGSATEDNIAMMRRVVFETIYPNAAVTARSNSNEDEVPGPIVRAG